jgi:tetratricopeptide (TPR) repeat protein
MSLDAIDLLAAGRFQDALAPLRAAVARDADDPVATLNLAIAEDRAGDRDTARRLMRAVAARLPHWDEPWLRLAESLRATGDHPGAEDAYRHAIALNPARTEALVALGGLLLLRGEAREARTLLRRCCMAAPDNAEAWDTLGRALRADDQDADALTAFHQAAELAPGNPEHLLNAIAVASDTDAELAHLEALCAQQPLNAAPQMARGMLLDRMARRTDAIDALDAAVALRPAELLPLKLLAGVLSRSSRIAEAEAAYRQICEADPDNPHARNDHAAVLMRLHRHAEARVILQGVLDQFGVLPNILCNLANATTCLGLQEDGVACARRAVALSPDAMLPRRALCNNLPYLDGTTGAELLEAMVACSDAVPRHALPPLGNAPDPDRRLTVALLSGSLRSHPVGWLTVAGIEALDPGAFDIVCLVQNAALHDPLARRFHAAASDWIEIDKVADKDLAELARSKGVDILIDLGGYGDGGRMTACGSRLAPVQVKWVGMQSHSSGLAEMDWFVTDRWETPDGFERFYSERLMRLPDGYVCYTPPPNAPDVVPLPALRNGFVTFGCYNNLAKITPKVIATWATVLRRVPASRMVLKTHQLGDPATAASFLDQFARHGIDPGRIETRGSSPHRAFMEQYGDVDIVLDPFPYSGGLTTCEALWMGVPTVTLPGEIFASRHSASHMSNAGLGDWLSGSVEEYIELAVARAADLPALAALRAELRERVRQSPLCDAPRFGQSLGAALRAAWQDWCAKAPTML